MITAILILVVILVMSVLFVLHAEIELPFNLGTKNNVIEMNGRKYRVTYKEVCGTQVIDRVIEIR